MESSFLNTFVGTKLVAAAALASAVLLGTIGGSAAAPIKPIDPLSGSYSGTSPSGGPVTIVTSPLYPVYSDGTIDYFGFPIPFLGSYSIAAYVGAVFTDNVKITSFQLYNALNPTTPGSSFVGATYQVLIPNKYFALNPITLAAGEYFLGVGTTGVNLSGPSGYSGVLAVTLSTVPLPSSLPMFGAALLGLGGVSYGLNRWAAPKGKKAAPTA